MAKLHAGGISLGTGFKIVDPTPIDDRLVVASTADLTNVSSLPNIYEGILVSVTADNGVYRWNGNDRQLLVNWEKLFVSSTSNNASLNILTLEGDIISSVFASGNSILNQNGSQLAIGAGSNFDDIQIGNGRNIKLTGPITASIISASSFIGDGSSLTGITIKNGFPYSGSDTLGGNPTQAVITGSLLVSGSGNITASIISVSNTIETNILSASNAEITNLSINGVTFESIESETNVIINTTTVFSGSVTIGSGSSLDPDPPIDNKHQITGSVEITGSGIFPSTNGTIDLGDINRKFSNLYAINTFFGGVHEINLETEGLDQMQEGTVLSLKNGILHPCEKEADPLVMGIVSKGENFPIVLGAEPILITGKIKEGDYIITSKIKGHGKGVNPKYIYNKKLFGKIIAQAIESGSGKSHIIKAMIRKM
jgi:hypothetical protein